MAVGMHEIKELSTISILQVRIPRTDWKWHDDAYHYVSRKMVLKLGWFTESGKWYYPTSSRKEEYGSRSSKEVANEYYYFNAAGEMQTG